MRVLVPLLSLVLTLLPPAASSSEEIRVRVNEFAPLYFQQDGEWVGLDAELAKAVVTEAGFTIKYVELPWSRAVSDLEMGRIDMIMNFSRTPERENFTHFMGPVRNAKRVLVVHRDNAKMKITNLDELADAARKANVPFGVRPDIRNDEAFDARYKSDAEFAKLFDPVSRSELFPKKTAEKRNLGFFQDLNYVIYHQKTKDPEFEDLVVHPFAFPLEPIYFGISKKLDAAKIEKLETAFQRLQANGKLEKIRVKWGKVK